MSNRTITKDRQRSSSAGAPRTESPEGQRERASIEKTGEPRANAAAPGKSKRASHHAARKSEKKSPGKSALQKGVEQFVNDLDREPFVPHDCEIEVPVDSLEARIGYGTLFRQMEHAQIRLEAYYRSEQGGALSPREAAEMAFHSCRDLKQVDELYRNLLTTPIDNIRFYELAELQGVAPRVAERLWEMIKAEARAEFESGHQAANVMNPVGSMKTPWNIAKIIGVRESFANDWNPTGGVELALIDMLAQSWLQWQFWLEQSIRRSQTPERHEDPEYTQWKKMQRELYPTAAWGERPEGEWLRPFLSERQAIEHAAQEAERWNKIFMRTLRQLRDLRRYAPVTINNASQVNIATDGGQQLNVSERS